jgi:hypothetical protein
MREMYREKEEKTPTVRRVNSCSFSVWDTVSRRISLSMAPVPYAIPPSAAYGMQVSSRNKGNAGEPSAASMRKAADS